MNRDEALKWKKLQGNKKSAGIQGFYTVVLWCVLVISIFNGISVYANPSSFLIATIAFCTLAIRAKISSEVENIIVNLEKKTEGKE